MDALLQEEKNLSLRLSFRRRPERKKGDKATVKGRKGAKHRFWSLVEVNCFSITRSFKQCNHVLVDMMYDAKLKLQLPDSSFSFHGRHYTSCSQSTSTYRKWGKKNILLFTKLWDGYFKRFFTSLAFTAIRERIKTTRIEIKTNAEMTHASLSTIQV